MAKNQELTRKSVFVLIWQNEIEPSRIIAIITLGTFLRNGPKVTPAQSGPTLRSSTHESRIARLSPDRCANRPRTDLALTPHRPGLVFWWVVRNWDGLRGSGSIYCGFVWGSFYVVRECRYRCSCWYREAGTPDGGSWVAGATNDARTRVISPGGVSASKSVIDTCVVIKLLQRVIMSIAGNRFWVLLLFNYIL